jgi:hypothetical protein
VFLPDAPVHTLKQFAEGDAETLGDFHKRFKRRNTLALFNPTNRHAVQSGVVSKRFLRESTGRT